MATRKMGFTALMTGLYSLLTTDSHTSSYTTYNYVPDHALPPYIAINSPIYTPSDQLAAKDTEGEDIIVIIDIWSEYKGDKEAADMMNNVCQAIDGGTLTVTGYTVVIRRIDFADIMIDTTVPSQPMRHGVIKARFHIA